MPCKPTMQWSTHLIQTLCHILLRPRKHQHAHHDPVESQDLGKDENKHHSDIKARLLGASTDLCHLKSVRVISISGDDKGRRPKKKRSTYRRHPLQYRWRIRPLARRARPKFRLQIVRSLDIMASSPRDLLGLLRLILSRR